MGDLIPELEDKLTPEMERDALASASKMFGTYIKEGTPWSSEGELNGKPSSFTVTRNSQDIAATAGIWTVDIKSLDPANTDRLVVMMNQDSLQTVLSEGRIENNTFNFMFTPATNFLLTIVGTVKDAQESLSMRLPRGKIEMDESKFTPEDRIRIAALYGVIHAARMMSSDSTSSSDQKL